MPSIQSKMTFEWKENEILSFFHMQNTKIANKRALKCEL